MCIRPPPILEFCVVPGGSGCKLRSGLRSHVHTQKTAAWVASKCESSVDVIILGYNLRFSWHLLVFCCQSTIPSNIFIKQLFCLHLMHIFTVLIAYHITYFDTFYCIRVSTQVIIMSYNTWTMYNNVRCNKQI